MGTLSFNDFELNKTFDLGTFIVSEEEIVDFALKYDPLDFHIDKEAAEKSIFKGLITSGPHLFHLFYKNRWVPLFKDTVIAGMEVNWRFLKPVYANMNVNCAVTITGIFPNPEKKSAVVKWLYKFTNDKNEILQTIEVTIMHKIN